MIVVVGWSNRERKKRGGGSSHETRVIRSSLPYPTVAFIAHDAMMPKVIKVTHIVLATDHGSSPISGPPTTGWSLASQVPESLPVCYGLHTVATRVQDGVSPLGEASRGSRPGGMQVAGPPWHV